MESMPGPTMTITTTKTTKTTMTTMILITMTIKKCVHLPMESRPGPIPRAVLSGRGGGAHLTPQSLEALK